MSAIAYFVTKKSIITLGEGIWVKDNQIVSEHMPKVCKLRENVAILAVGTGVPAVHKAGQDAARDGLKWPDQIAGYISNSIKQELTRDKQKESRANYLYLVIGYEQDGRPCFWQLAGTKGTTNDYTPRLFQEKPGGANCVAHDSNATQTPFRSLLAGNIKSGMGNEEAAVRAFRDTCSELKSQGLNIGETIYCEVLEPS